jgi:hypothetical protein
MHPQYTFEQDKQFLKELYRLKGFAYLRSDSNQDSHALVKSAKAFEKALSQEQETEVVRIRKK